MTNSSLEPSLRSLPSHVFCFLKSFLTDPSQYEMLKKYLAETSLVLEKDGYQISLSSIEELEAIKMIVQKGFVSNSPQYSCTENPVC